MFTYQDIILYVNLIAPELVVNCQMYIFTWIHVSPKYVEEEVILRSWFVSDKQNKKGLVLSMSSDDWKDKEKSATYRTAATKKIKTSLQSHLEDYHLNNPANLQIKITGFVEGPAALE